MELDLFCLVFYILIYGKVLSLLYHQLLPQGYCSTSTKAPSIYNMGQGKILEIIVSIIWNGKKYYSSNLKLLQGSDMLQNTSGPFNLPGISGFKWSGNKEPLVTFISMDNSLKKIYITSHIKNLGTLSLNLEMNYPGPVTNTYKTNIYYNLRILLM